MLIWQRARAEAAYVPVSDVAEGPRAAQLGAVPAVGVAAYAIRL